MDPTKPSPGTIRVSWGTRTVYEGEHHQEIPIPDGMTAEELVRALHDDTDYESILPNAQKDDGECAESDRWIIATVPALPVAPERAKAQQQLEDSRRILNLLETVKALAEHVIKAYQDAVITDLGTSLADAERALEEMTTHAECAQQFYGLAALTHEDALPTVAEFVWQHADTAESAAIGMSSDLQNLAHELGDRGGIPAHADPAVNELITRVLATGSYYDHAI